MFLVLIAAMSFAPVQVPPGAYVGTYHVGFYFDSQVRDHSKDINVSITAAHIIVRRGETTIKYFSYRIDENGALRCCDANGVSMGECYRTLVGRELKLVINASSPSGTIIRAIKD